MSNLLFSRKGQVQIIRIVWITLCVLFTIIYLCDTSQPFGKDKDLLYLNVSVRIITYTALIINLIICIKQSKSYIAIYDDCIEGIGIEGRIKSVQFLLKNGEYVVTKNKTKICINSFNSKIIINFSSKEESDYIYKMLNKRNNFPFVIR